MDETGAHYTEWSKPVRKTPIQYTNIYIGEGKGTLLQYSCLENPMDRGAWWAVVHRVPQSRTRLSDFPFTFHFHALEKEMATHSSVLAWRIPGMGDPGGLQSMGSHRVGHDWRDLAECIYMEFRKMVMITLYARQKKTHRCTEQSFGLCGRRRGWDDLREQHWNIYIINCETDHESRFDAWDKCWGLVH